MILNGVPNYLIPSTGQWFKVQLLRNGEKIYEGITDGISEEGSEIKVAWSMLQNKYTSSVLDPSAITVTETGSFTYNGYLGKNTNGGDPANIVKCQVIYKNLEYYATLPLITAVTTDGSEIKLKKNTGFRYAVYTTDGIRPQYDDREPFIIEGISEDANITYNLCGTIYGEDKNGVVTWQNKTDLEVNTRKSTAAWTALRPVDRYSGQCVSNAIEYVFDNGSIHIPMQLVYNRYGNSAMNGWDGNSISINDDGGFILAPKVGAGRKETNNTFTGMFMGEVKEAGKSKTDVGLMGYVQGQRSLFLNAEDGSAIFGVQEKGQIILDPKADKAYIYSNYFWKNYGQDGKPSSYGSGNENGQGLLIDLTTPAIRYGNGNFEVDANGNLTAKNANISGSITATSGEIGNFTIEDCLYSGLKNKINANKNGVYLGSDGIGIGKTLDYYISTSEHDNDKTVTKSAIQMDADDGRVYMQAVQLGPYWTFDSNGCRCISVEMDINSSLKVTGLYLWTGQDARGWENESSFEYITSITNGEYSAQAYIGPFYTLENNQAFGMYSTKMMVLKSEDNIRISANEGNLFIEATTTSTDPKQKKKIYFKDSENADGATDYRLGKFVRNKTSSFWIGGR